MQSQSMLVMISLLITIPLMILFSNHEVFFVLFSFVMLFSATKNIFDNISDNRRSQSKDIDEQEINLSEYIGIDLEKLEIITKASFGFFVVLYYFYLFIYIQTFYLKVLVIFICLYTVYKVYLSIVNSKDPSYDSSMLFPSWIEVGVSMSIIFVTIYTSMDKYFLN